MANEERTFAAYYMTQNCQQTQQWQQHQQTTCLLITGHTHCMFRHSSLAWRLEVQGESINFAFRIGTHHGPAQHLATHPCTVWPNARECLNCADRNTSMALASETALPSNAKHRSVCHHMGGFRVGVCGLCLTAHVSNALQGCWPPLAPVACLLSRAPTTSVLC